MAAALAGWLVPGLGHMLIGQRHRGGILMVTLILLWAAGLTVGGINVIDHRSHAYWFAGQMLIGPSVAVDWYHQRIKQGGSPQPESVSGRVPAYIPSFGRIAEQGRLFIALAGLLNLVAVIDVLYREPAETRADAGRDAPAASPGVGEPSKPSQSA